MICAGVFKPPLGQQRYQHVASLLRGAGASNVLDLGCGDGKLLDFLLSQTANGGGGAANSNAVGWRRLTGLDVSESAVARGCKRVQVPAGSWHVASDTESLDIEPLAVSISRRMRYEQKESASASADDICFHPSRCRPRTTGR